jgi:hypothetical protein
LKWGFKAVDGLLVAVRLNVMLGCVTGVLNGMGVMGVGQVRVVGGFFVIAFRVMLGGCMVMARGVLMVLRCLRVVLSCFV